MPVALGFYLGEVGESGIVHKVAVCQRKNGRPAEIQIMTFHTPGKPNATIGDLVLVTNKDNRNLDNTSFVSIKETQIKNMVRKENTEEIKYALFDYRVHKQDCDGFIIQHQDLGQLECTEQQIFPGKYDFISFNVIVSNDGKEEVTLKIKEAYKSDVRTQATLNPSAFDLLDKERKKYQEQFLIDYEIDPTERVKHEEILQTKRWKNFNLLQLDAAREPVKLEGLTGPQSQAVQSALNQERKLVAIEGKPGSGKTVVAAKIIVSLMEKEKILVLSPAESSISHIKGKVEHMLREMSAKDKIRALMNKRKYESQLCRQIPNIMKEISVYFGTVNEELVNQLVCLGFEPSVCLIEDIGLLTERGSLPAIVRNCHKLIMTGAREQLPIERRISDEGEIRSFIEKIMEKKIYFTCHTLHTCYRRARVQEENDHISGHSRPRNGPGTSSNRGNTQRQLLPQEEIQRPLEESEDPEDTMFQNIL